MLIILALSVCFNLASNDSINGDNVRQSIDLNGVRIPNPHMIDVAEPVAMYTISTTTVDFTFDANYYSEYTIHLVGEYVEMDYFVYTPVVYIPVATFGEIVDIYIESADCGSYYGVLDKTAFTSME